MSNRSDYAMLTVKYALKRMILRLFQIKRRHIRMRII